METRIIGVKPVATIGKILAHLQGVGGQKLPYASHYLNDFHCGEIGDIRDVYLVSPKDFLKMKDHCFAPLSLLLGLCAYEADLRNLLGDWFEIVSYPAPTCKDRIFRVKENGVHCFPSIYLDKRPVGTDTGDQIRLSEKDFEFSLQVSTWESGLRDSLDRSINPTGGCLPYFAMVRI